MIKQRVRPILKKKSQDKSIKPLLSELCSYTPLR